MRAVSLCEWAYVRGTMSVPKALESMMTNEGHCEGNELAEAPTTVNACGVGLIERAMVKRRRGRRCLDGCQMSDEEMTTSMIV